MYNSPFHIQLQKKLSDLADILVPETFRNEAPQYYDLIKAFLANVQKPQDSLNMSLLDYIDVNKITEEDITDIYFKTYLATLNITEDENTLYGKDLLRLSKDLSMKKGTISLYFILINLLTYLLPSISNYYFDLLNLLETGNLTAEERANIENDLADLREAGLISSAYVEVVENDVFNYDVLADIDAEHFWNNVKPFCHPAGWHVNFTRVILRYIKDKIYSYEKFNITLAVEMPSITANYGGLNANPTGDDIGIEPRLQKWILGDASEAQYYEKAVLDDTKIYVDGTSIYYDFGQVTLSKDVNNQFILDFDSSSTLLNKATRYVESDWVFPSAVVNANHIYKANNQGIIANGGAISNYYGKFIMYQYITSNDIY